jgi:uncharacterized protein (TIGR02145 family)
MKTLKILFFSWLFFLISICPSYAFGQMVGMLGSPFVCGSSSVSYLGINYGTVVGEDANCWFTQNLGAPAVPSSATNSANYGWLFQWGRGWLSAGDHTLDGHQLRNSSETGTNATSDYPGDALFITEDNSPWDWRVPQNPNLWQGVDGVNNPCPLGWRIPTSAEWTAWIAAASVTNIATAYSSNLKIPASGRHNDTSAGGLQSEGTIGWLWTSDVGAITALAARFGAGAQGDEANDRALGLSVRCIKD